MTGLPVIDLAAPPDPRALRRACEELGFFYVANHGVNSALEHRLEQLTREVFSLPRASLEAIAMPKGGRAWRGWFGLGGELTSGLPDAKEGIYFGRELPASPLPLHGPNLFPAELPELKPVVLEWMAAVEKAGQRVLELLAVSLELDAGFFARGLTREPLPLFRVFHYPGAAEGWGVGEHTDYGLLTLLKQDDCGGLEVKTPSGWLEAEPMPGTFVCNLGDMLDRITGGQYRSTPHRVKNRTDRSRYSWPFFLDPSFGAEVAPLPGARVRPAAVDAAERWDRASVHTLSGTYGEYLIGKVSKVFPRLKNEVLE